MYFEWTKLQVSLNREQYKDITTLKMAVDGAVVPVNEDKIVNVYDFPEPKMTHTIGASFQDGGYVKHFRGFIAIAEINYGDATGVVDYTTDCKGFCNMCKIDAVSECFGSCNWNHYYSENDDKCMRCPLWCREGCNMRGAC
jgi:hypothetical protein